jgi:hypothetical protein
LFSRSTVIRLLCQNATRSAAVATLALCTSTSTPAHERVDAAAWVIARPDHPTFPEQVVGELARRAQRLDRLLHVLEPDDLVQVGAEPPSARCLSGEQAAISPVNAFAALADDLRMVLKASGRGESCG